MTAEESWLDEIVVVNESTDERRPGDVSLHRSVGDACEAVEYWWVRNGEAYAFTASGIRLVFAAEPKGPVTIVRRESCPEGPAIVLSWLRSLAETTLEARERVARDGRAVLNEAEKRGALPASTEGLIAYIGLPWAAPRSWFVPGCLALLATISILLAIVVRGLF